MTATKGLTLPLLSDPEMKIISAYGVAMDGEDIAVPATFIIDQERRIRWKYVGENMTDRPDSRGLLELAVAARAAPDR